MKRVLLQILAAAFPVFAQFNAPEFEGFYQGIRGNTTVQYFAPAFITINIDESISSIEMIFELDGIVFGATDPDPAIMLGTYDDNGFSVEGNSPPYGEMSFTGLANGTITGRFPNVPGPDWDSTTLQGTYNQDSIYMTYIVYSGGSVFANGFIDVKRDPSTGIERLPIVIDNFFLFQNYPNPFNPSTTIQFAVSKESFIKLEIFNALGEKVSTLVSETLSAGTYKYEGEQIIDGFNKLNEKAQKYNWRLA